MDREDKIKLAIKRGVTYNTNTGKIYGVRGNEFKKHSSGYIKINSVVSKKTISIYGHHFAYYIVYGKIVDYLDHIDGDKSNNKIDNLREVTIQQNAFNIKKVKGYYLNKITNRFAAQIKINQKRVHLGYFDTEQEARQAYLDAKKIYHII